MAQVVAAVMSLSPAEVVAAAPVASPEGAARVAVQAVSPAVAARVGSPAGEVAAVAANAVVAVAAAMPDGCRRLAETEHRKSSLLPPQ